MLNIFSYILKIYLYLQFLFGFIFVSSAIAEETKYVNVYSARQSELIKPLLIKFSETYNIKFRLVTGKADQLLERLKREGKNTQADVILTTDAGRLWRASKLDLLKTVDNNSFNTLVPKDFRDSNNKWWGLSLRARVFVYSKERVKMEELKGYLDLEDKKWKGRILTRSSSNIYNQSLIASMIDVYGLQRTEIWAKKLVKNFSRKPVGGDRDQIRAVAAGEGDIAIVNSYYYANMLLSSEKDKISNTAIYFPSNNRFKTHFNISGIGITKYAKNYDEALILLKFLLGDEAQSMYASLNHEYPIRENIDASNIVKKFGDFELQKTPVEIYGKFNSEAIKIADKVGWR